MIYTIDQFRFKWNTSKLPREFSIVPAIGYCSPGMNVNFIVSFRPTQHDSLIEGDVSTYIISSLMCLYVQIFDQQKFRNFHIYVRYKNSLHIIFFIFLNHI